MVEKKYDQLLGIKTTGIREWRDRSKHYNRYEATPYTALDKLFQVYTLNRSDKVVDFGCGRGRVCFYINYHFQVPVTGVENNDTTFEEALENKMGYRRVVGNTDAPIRFEYGLAEDHVVDATDNVFYFFNPFSLQIFKKVINNILRSVKEKRRMVELILYYPLPEFTLFLKKSTPFTLMNKVDVPGDHGKYGKFLIYRLK